MDGTYDNTKQMVPVKVKSFGMTNQSLPISDYIMPFSHFARIGNDKDKF